MEKEADGRYGKYYWDDIRGRDLIDHRIDPVEVFSQDSTAEHIRFLTDSKNENVCLPLQSQNSNRLYSRNTNKAPFKACFRLLHLDEASLSRSERLNTSSCFNQCDVSSTSIDNGLKHGQFFVRLSPKYHFG